MRHEVIEITDRGANYPELIKLLRKKKEPLHLPDDWNVTIASIRFFHTGQWKENHVANDTITDIAFIQKYGENAEPEPDKERELLEKFCEVYWAKASAAGIIDNFLSSLRKPAFELVTADNVRVTDSEQWVYHLNPEMGHGITTAKTAKKKGYKCWASEQAALDYRLQNTPAIKLSDMFDDRCGYYQIAVEKAHNLVNERIK